MVEMPLTNFSTGAPLKLGVVSPVDPRDRGGRQQPILIVRNLKKYFPVRGGVLHRSTFDEALTWLDIHGERPETVAHWRALQAESLTRQPHGHDDLSEPAARPRRRRRRRRRSRFASR